MFEESMRKTALKKNDAHEWQLTIMRIAKFKNARQQSIIQIQHALESRFARSSIRVHKAIRSI
jgi:hypothetical protein